MPSSKYPTDAERWAAVRSRDPAADGHFIYTVRTTKIFCRPTCNARLARRSNIDFVDTSAEAQAAGFRACKRCKPELEKFVPESDLSIEKVRQMLENLPENAPLPKLEQMAARAGLTKYHFHRCFKKATGLTPRDYALQRRQIRLPQPLAAPESNISTPSLMSDAARPSSSLTPDTVKTPEFAFDDWLMAGPEDPTLLDDLNFPYGFVDSNFPIPGDMDLTKGLSDTPMTFPIYYSTVDTTHGVVLMAFEEAQVCKLELVATAQEAMQSLERSFPNFYYDLVPVERLQDDQRPSVQQKVRAVVDALEHPAGKPMHFAIPTPYHNELT